MGMGIVLGNGGPQTETPGTTTNGGGYTGTTGTTTNGGHKFGSGSFNGANYGANYAPVDDRLSHLSHLAHLSKVGGVSGGSGPAAADAARASFPQNNGNGVNGPVPFMHAQAQAPMMNKSSTFGGAVGNGNYGGYPGSDYSRVVQPSVAGNGVNSSSANSELAPSASEIETFLLTERAKNINAMAMMSRNMSAPIPQPSPPALNPSMNQLAFAPNDSIPPIMPQSRTTPGALSMSAPGVGAARVGFPSRSKGSANSSAASTVVQTQQQQQQGQPQRVDSHISHSNEAGDTAVVPVLPVQPPSPLGMQGMQQPMVFDAAFSAMIANIVQKQVSEQMEKIMANNTAIMQSLNTAAKAEAA